VRGDIGELREQCVERDRPILDGCRFGVGQPDLLREAQESGLPFQAALG